MREGLIETKGGKIWYSVYGENEKGVPLLVLHGGPGLLSMPEVVEELSDQRPVYFYDQLGCGKSDRAGDKSYYSVANYVEELAEIRERLGLREVYIMGFSWGTMLACSFMLEKRPEGIKGLILCGSYLSSPRWHADQRENLAQMPCDIKNTIEESERNGDYGEKYQAAIMHYYRRHLCRLDPWPEFLQEAFSKLNMDVYLTMWGPSEITITGTLKDCDLLPRLKKIKEPVLLICGEHDEAGIKTVEDYCAAFSEADMVILPGASHMHHLEKPELFLRTVRKFLKH
ncbi:MAG: proline iminopeptidase-family hydrolase [Candidatus Omnitrophica bacterium]|nr:proline iminopeptidase-family hydrolase [Candidatus Omnitrophota bacterium]